jgi:hypothetical protein
MKIRAFKQILGSLFNPPDLGRKLTLRTMPIATRIIGLLFVAALIAAQPVTTEPTCSTIAYVLDHFAMSLRQTSEFVRKALEDLGHFKTGFGKRVHLTTPVRSSSSGLLTPIFLTSATRAYRAVERISECPSRT